MEKPKLPLSPSTKKQNVVAPIATKATAQEEIQGFLVPRFYRNLNFYKTNPIYKSTLLIFLLIASTAIIDTYLWYLSNSNKTTILETQQIETDASAEIQNQITILKPTRDKYREIEILRRQLRIPLTPILDAIEKTIPETISINRIVSNCPPIASTPSIHRKTQIQIETYFPPNVDPTDAFTSSWIQKLKEKLKGNGLNLVKTEWSMQRKFNPTTEQEKRIKNNDVGYVKDLAITIELAENK